MGFPSFWVQSQRRGRQAIADETVSGYLCATEDLGSENRALRKYLLEQGHSLVDLEAREFDAHMQDLDVNKVEPPRSHSQTPQQL